MLVPPLLPATSYPTEVCACRGFPLLRYTGRPGSVCDEAFQLSRAGSSLCRGSGFLDRSRDRRAKRRRNAFGLDGSLCAPSAGGARLPAFSPSEAR
jgi:hypothetical protein